MSCHENSSTQDLKSEKEEVQIVDDVEEISAPPSATAYYEDGCWRYEKEVPLEANAFWSPDEEYLVTFKRDDSLFLDLHDKGHVEEFNLIEKEGHFELYQHGQPTGKTVVMEHGRMQFNYGQGTFSLVAFKKESHFLSGLWKEKDIIERLKQGELLLEADWTHVKTFVNEDRLRLEERLVMDGSSYYLIGLNERFYLHTYPADERIEEQHLIFEDSILRWSQENRYIDYVQIDTTSVSKAYYFQGEYEVRHPEDSSKTFSTTLLGDGTIQNWILAEGIVEYDSHFGYDQPVFTLSDGKGELVSYHIKDTETGFDLYEVTNPQELEGIDAVVEVGKKQFIFTKQ